MSSYRIELKSEASDSFRAIKAANSCDLDLDSKLCHKFAINFTLPDEWNIGLIVGNSGSGKSTLAQHIWGIDFCEYDENKNVIDQFPETFSYDDCVSFLTKIGLNAVSRWLVPMKVLSNGERYRAIFALMLARSENTLVLDEFTSVIDRVVAKALSHSTQKLARKMNKKLILLSCHFDIIEWLNPDWIINADKQTFELYKKKDRNNYVSTSELVKNQRGRVLASITI